MRHRGACGVAGLLLLLVSSGAASAGLVPGGGPQASDCYIEVDVQGVESPGPLVQSNRIVRCTDGDACDTDGVCGDDSCTLQVAVCIGQSDPNLPACDPPDVLRRLPMVNARLQSALPPTMSGTACGTPVGLTLPVRVRRNGKKLPGRVAVPANAVAERGVTPARDRDKYVFQCLPRTAPCPAATTPTTTPTTTLPAATTTTTVPAGGPAIVQVGPGNSFRFDPPEVRIRAGGSVRWRFASAGHNVVSGSGGTPDGRFCSPNDQACALSPLAPPGTSYERTFTEPGTYPYFCAPHVLLNMTGRVIVDP